MSKQLATLAICFALGLATGAQASSRPAQQDKDKDKDSQARQAQKAQKVKITHGPVVESVKPTTATIAWSTNVKASTILKYGSNPQALSGTAEAPWGRTNHRVYLHNLKPGTTYYYRVESTQALGTGTQAVSGVEQFRTQGGAAAAAQPAAAPSPPAASENRSRQMALRTFHQFLVTHPNIKADLQKNPNLAKNGTYKVQHPGFNQFLQTHHGVEAWLAQNPQGFVQSEEQMR